MKSESGGVHRGCDGMPATTLIMTSLAKRLSCNIILPAGNSSEQPGPPEGSGGEGRGRVGVG